AICVGATIGVCTGVCTGVNVLIGIAVWVGWMIGICGAGLNWALPALSAIADSEVSGRSVCGIIISTDGLPGGTEATVGALMLVIVPAGARSTRASGRGNASVFTLGPMK